MKYDYETTVEVDNVKLFVEYNVEQVTLEKYPEYTVDIYEVYHNGVLITSILNDAVLWEVERLIHEQEQWI